MNYPQLEYEALTNTVTGVKIREGSHPLTAKFSPTKINVEGDVAKWDEALPRRDLDTEFETRSGMATNTNTGTVRPKSSQMAITFKKREIQPELIRMLRNPGSEAKASAEQRLGLMLGDMTRRYVHERWEFLLAGCLQDNLSFTVEGVSHSPDFGLDASHDLTAAASWATPSTDIDADVEAIKRLIAEDSGRAVREALCGRDIFGNFRRNDQIKEWYQAREGAPADLRAMQHGGVNGTASGESVFLFGLVWTQYNNGYVPVGGSWTPYIPDDKVIFIPEVSSEWIQMQEGSVMYPSKPMAGGHGEMLSAFNESFGVAAWSRFLDEPPSAWAYLRWAGLPVLVDPSAIVNLDTTP